MKKYPKGENVVGHVDDYTDADMEELERKFEMMSAEGARAMAANFGDPSVDYSKIDFSKPEKHEE